MSVMDDMEVETMFDDETTLQEGVEMVMDLIESADIQLSVYGSSERAREFLMSATNILQGVYERLGDVYLELDFSKWR